MRRPRTLVTVAVTVGAALAVAAAVPAGSVPAPPKPRLYAWGNNTYGQMGLPSAARVSGERAFGSDAAAPVIHTTRIWHKVSVASAHTMAIHQNGSLYTWGVNMSGAMGIDPNIGPMVSEPTRLTKGRYLDVATGDRHSLAIRSDGALFAVGSNEYGQLGTGDTAERMRFSRVGGAADWVDVEVSPSGASFAIKADGSLWSWGRNRSGELGQGTVDFEAHSRPEPVLPGTSFVSVSAGGANTHVLAVTADGTLFAWGADCLGQLGLGGSPSDTPHCDDRLVPTPSVVGTGVASAVAGTGWDDHSFSAAVTTDGDLVAWGSNFAGALGVGSWTGLDDVATTPRLVGDGYRQVSLGFSFVLAIRTDGTLWSWGMNAAGQLGRGPAGPGLGDDGSWIDEPGAYDPVPGQVGSLSGWLTVGAGGLHALAVR